MFFIKWQKKTCKIAINFGGIIKKSLLLHAELAYLAFLQA